MKLAAYIVRVDSGFSPNPFGRYCTLACRKPSIRRKAEPGDIIVGSGSIHSAVSGRLIYAMRIREVLPLQTYWKCYPSKRPSSRTPVTKRGDNIWHRDISGAWRGVRGALHDERHSEHDVRGEHALIASEFYYFGRDAIEVPKRFKGILATTQGHKNTYDVDLITRFWDWLSAAAPKAGRIGQPSEFREVGCALETMKVPSPGEFRKGYRAFQRRERRDAMYKTAEFLILRFWWRPADLANGLGVLLLTWNQAFYRYGGFDFAKLERCLRKNVRALGKFHRRDILSYSAEDNKAVVSLFQQFLTALRSHRKHGRLIKSPVSVAKALHMLAPNFFPLWDDKIARAYRCYYSVNPEGKYLKFIRQTKLIAEHLEAHTKVARKGRTLLKLIDEYNYAKFTKRWV